MLHYNISQTTRPFVPFLSRSKNNVKRLSETDERRKEELPRIDKNSGRRNETQINASANVHKSLLFGEPLYYKEGKI